jgi:hypothetical protein
MKGKYEIKSKATGKVVYEGESDDVANDWNVKKRLLLLDRDSDRKLRANLEKHGIQDFEFSVMPEEVLKPKAVKKPIESEIIEPEPEVVKKPKKVKTKVIFKESDEDYAIAAPEKKRSKK